MKESNIKESTLQEKLEEWKQKARVLKRKAKVLNRRKDLLHLILSYPMKPEADVDFDSLTSTLFRINQQVRELEVCLAQEFDEDKYYILFRETENDFRDVKGSLDKWAIDMMAYLPQDMVENMLEPPKADTALAIKPELIPSITSTFEEAPRKNEMLPIPQGITNLAIEFAIRQISKCIKEGEIRRIGISGFLAEKVAEALKDLPEIRSMFDVVLCISVSRHHTIKEIERDIALQINEIRRTATSKAPLGNFLLLLDCINEDGDLHELKIPDDGCLILTSRSHNVYQIMDVDLEIRTKDHLFPWELFCKNVGQILVHDIAVRLIERCHGHLLAIILLARALKDVTDVSVWELALHELTSQHSSQVEGMSEDMVRVLSYIWERKDINTKKCIEYCASRPKGTNFQKPSLVNHWIANGLIETQEEGENILKDLINSFLLENVTKGCVQVREETILVLSEKLPFMNNKLSKLPKRPFCPNLTALFLQMNYNLMVIPTTFFERMPALQVLDLSYTSIKSLPQSISKLVVLRKFLLKGCKLLMKLPPEIGALRNLEVFDIEGTELVCLPKEIGELINLTCLKVSFDGYANRYRESKQIDAIIPRMALSKLTQLKELSIDVNPDDEWWDEEVETVINELCWLRNLETLDLYLPTVELLQQFLQLERNSNQLLVYSALSNFKLTVGRQVQRIISRLPEELEKDFKNLDKCLNYINGEDKAIEIREALKHANAFFLDRHWTVKKLSEFGKDEMYQLKFCLLVECNEIRTIIEGGEFYGKRDNEEDNNPVLGSLQYLSILYMKNLESIWEGPIVSGCLSYLMSLALHKCPSLTTIFTLGLLPNLVHLKELIVEDCPKIHSLVSLEASCSESNRFLPSLKKISLLDLPELISIFSGLHIAPQLERMIIYNCPKLETLSTMEVSSKDLKVIKGEREWWDTLKWHKLEWSSGQPDYLVRIFVPLRRDGDLMAQLADGNSSFLKVQHAGGCKIKVEVELMLDVFVPKDRIRYTLLGQNISLQLISAVDGDPANKFRGKVGQPSYFEDRNTTISSIDRGNVALSGTFNWDEKIGVPGAFIIKSFGTHFYLKTLTIEDVPSHGRIHFACNSWISPAFCWEPGRVFFTNQTYLPSETPAPLRLYREEELMKLRGDGTRMLRKWDRVYDYAYYNDLGDPDKAWRLNYVRPVPGGALKYVRPVPGGARKYARPVLGGSTEYPYPRRGKTGRPPTWRDPDSESRPSSDNYVPRDERFGGFKLRFLEHTKRRIKKLPSLLNTPLDITPNDFDTFQDVLKRYEELELTIFGCGRKISFENYKKFLVIKENKFSWKTDKEFAREMLAGANPVIIRLLQEFPPTSKLDPEVYGNQISSIPKGYIETNLDGLTFEEAIKNNRIFILDHHDAFMPYLRQMNTTSSRTYATRTILFLQRDGNFKPLAIELSLPHPGGDQFGAISKVCTPAEHGVQGSIWHLAKAYVAVNDSGYQLISHWLNTHAVIEPFVIATNRQLSVLHPIYKLLHPHFRHIMHINAFARRFLINADGVLEKTFSTAEFGMEMSAAAYKNWVFPEQALPVDLIKRGMAVEDSNSPHGLRLLIEDYPYAVDGLEIWLAIKAWVEDYCNFYYKTDNTEKLAMVTRKMSHGGLKCRLLKS
uniref:Lipoxygenase n=1 Tax=Davidia involucrata TaxID=16924 RepID=A0A5B7B1M6_DAVIN